MRGRLVGGRRQIEAGLLLALVGCTPSRVPAATTLAPSTTTATTTATTARTTGSRWRTLNAPSLREVAVLARTEAGLEGIDEAGVRWWFPPDGGPAQTSSSVDTTALQTRYFDHEEGLVAVTRDARVLTSKHALDPWSEVGRLPDEATPETARLYRGGLTVHVGADVFAAADGRHFSLVVPPLGKTIEDLFLDRDGIGIGAFLPQLLAITRDGGKSWSPVPRNDLLRSHSLEHRGDGFVARYFQGRDFLARGIELPSGKTRKLSLSELPSSVHPSSARLRDAATEWRRAAATEAPTMPTALVVEGVAWGRAALDGDALVVFPDLPERASGGKATFATLGEPLPWPPGAGSIGGERSASALCRGRAATVSGSSLHVFHEASGRHHAVAAARDTAVGFDEAGALLTVSPTLPGVPAMLRRHDPESGRTLSETALPALRTERPRLVGGCRTRALWLVTETEAARVEDAALGTLEAHAPGAIAVGINHDRELVLSRHRALDFLPSRRSVSSLAVDARHISFALDGRHGLLSTGEGQVLQTDDGGHHFTPIEAPPVLTPQVPLCGEQRCQLGERLARDGFERGAASIATWPRSHASRRPPAAETRAAANKHAVPGPPAMRCSADASFFSALPKTYGVVAPRLGDLLFSAGTADFSAPRSDLTVFGDVQGRSIVSPHFSRDGLTPFARGTRPRSSEPLYHSPIVQWRPDLAPERVFADDDDEGSLRNPMLIGRSGEGTFVGHAADLVIWGDRPARVFPWRSDDRFWGGGVFQEEAGDEVLVAMMVGLAQGVTLLRTGRTVEPEGNGGTRGARGTRERYVVAEHRALAFHPLDRAPDEEITIGLGHGENGPYLVLREQLETGAGSQLTKRDIQTDLTLGPPRPIARTQTPRKELMSLPTCGAGAGQEGALIRTRARHVRSVTIGAAETSGYVARVVRLDLGGACVERTLLTGTHHSLRGDVVVAGNGGLGVVPGPVRGARCSPVATGAVRHDPTLTIDVEGYTQGPPWEDE